LIATAVLAVAGALGVGMAQAHGSNVQWSVTIGAPVVSVPVPVLPVPVFRPAPVVVVPSPVYGPRYHVGYREPTRWDRDGDGIPNRYDRLYNPRWDRDGDGIPNWRDRFDNRRFDRDGDGRYDRCEHHERHEHR
jgi:hypothetical protein